MPTIPPTTGNGPWRILIFDRDEADPKWILATVVMPSDVQGATTDPFTAAAEAAGWVRAQLGDPAATLTPMTRVSVWRVDEGGSGVPQEAHRGI